MADGKTYKLGVPPPKAPDEEVSRREVLQLIGASALLSACEPPRGTILPYTRQPREVIPGKPLTYATSMTERGIAWGLLAQSHVGRPVKVDGNPDHPTTLGGGSTPSLQASLYDLYDPARGKGIRARGQAKRWSAFQEALRDQAPGGRGLHFLLEPTSSPLLISQIEEIRTTLPEARFHFFDPLRGSGAEEAYRRALGKVQQSRYGFDRAWSIAAFDADFLTDPPERIRYAHDFSQTRRVLGPQDRMSRLWVAEGDLTVTGALADERMRVKPSGVPRLLASLVAEISRLGATGVTIPEGLGGEASPWIRRLAQDLWANQGASLVVVGDRQPPEAHLAALLANQLLGNVGTTLEIADPVVFEAGEASHDLGALAAALDAGQVSSLIVLGGDPARTAPAELEFGERISRAKASFYVGLNENQTAARCDWYHAGLHYLERWGDGRAHDGTVSLTQPLIRPLVGGKSHAEILAGFLGDPQPDGEALLRRQYASLSTTAWQTALQWGFLEGATPPSTATLDEGALVEGLRQAASRSEGDGLELSIRPDNKLKDGLSSSNAWLVELPDPVTSLSWQNAALLSPRTAERHGLREGQVVNIQRGDRSIRIPVFPFHGVAEDVVSLSLGWGQRPPMWSGGRASAEEPVGTDVYPLRSSDSPWFIQDATLSPARGSTLPLLGDEPIVTELIRQQEELDDQGRPILLNETVANWKQNPNFVAPHNEPAKTLYAPWNYSGDQWAMSIDLSTCIGCAACVVACQAENNTPPVGKTNARKRRMMHWLRIDRYRLGTSEDDAQLLPQPMLCQHCEMAPCEYVCPVNATVHSPDGLNEMVYNRCIGTRFCSNNCPYKVRRFNYFRYNGPLQPESLKMINNPEVTVRERGVMEKCTYCVQRIRTAQIDARVEGRGLRDGEVKTACQVACPTQAIVFGSIADPDSQVSQLHRSPRSYSVLNHELGTEPRTRYLAHIQNRSEEQT